MAPQNLPGLWDSVRYGVGSFNFDAPAPLVTYTITYDGNGNTGGSVPIDPNLYPAGSIVTVSGNVNSLTKTGNLFYAWNISAVGLLGKNYTSGNTFIINSNMTLFAQWVSAGHIGAFYFGPIYEAVTIDPVTITVSAIEPTIFVYANVNNAVILDPVTIIVIPQETVVVESTDISVDFVGVPRAGFSPLIVDFKALVTFGNNYNNKYRVGSYIWYFDYDNFPTVTETTTSSEITHIYTGYKGQKYSVKLCITVESM